MIYLWRVGLSGIPFTAGGIFGFERALSLAGIYMSTPRQDLLVSEFYDTKPKGNRNNFSSFLSQKMNQFEWIQKLYVYIRRLETLI